MTQPAFSNSEQNWEAIAGFLEQRGHHLDRDFEIRALIGGSANFNYLVSMNGQKAVLRRPPYGPLPPGAHDIRREYTVLSRLGNAYPPAPKGLVLCEDTSIIGVPFCISEFREGICIGRQLPKALESRENIGDQLCGLMFNSLSDLHSVNISEVGLEGLGSADGYLERQVNGWIKRCQRVTPEQLNPLLETIHRKLTDLLPEQRLSSLVHNDFKLDNMLIDPDTLRINGVVDWDMATIGDPVYELMILISYMGSNGAEDIYQFQCRMPCEADGWWSRSRALTTYLNRKNLTINEQSVQFYWWLAQLRNLGIFAQLNVLFTRTNKRPAALTEEECNSLEERCAALLDHIEKNIDQLPHWYR